MDTMMQKLKQYYITGESDYLLKKLTNESLKKIYELLFDNVIFEPSNDYELIFSAEYYEWRNKQLAKQYYLQAIEHNNTFAMLMYGKFLDNIGKRDESDMYIKMAFDKGNVYVMYHNIKKYLYSEEAMTKAIEYYNSTKNNPESMYYLGVYYFMKQNDNNNTNKEEMIENMMKYLLMAIDEGHTEAMITLGDYYDGIDDYNMVKYYTMALKNNNNYAYYKLERYYKNKDNGYYELLKLVFANNKNELVNLINIKKDFFGLGDNKSLLEIINELTYDEIKNITNKNVIIVWNLLREKVDLIEMHFKYAVNGDGFKEAKNDFIDRVVKYCN